VLYLGLFANRTLGRVVQAVKNVERRPSLVYPTLISFGIAVCVSCAEKPPPPPPQTVAIEPPPPPAPSPPKPRVFPLPPRKPAEPPENPAEAPASGSETVALATPETPTQTLERSQLVGLDEPAARRLLGAATEQSTAPPANIWRYRTASCELDLFFYLDLRSGKMRTLHYSFKGDQGGEDCLRAVVAARSN
jgi:outer membrane biosynthesis protein TonB